VEGAGAYTLIKDTGEPYKADRNLPCSEANAQEVYTQKRDYIGHWAGTAVKDTTYYRYRGWVEATVQDPTHPGEESGSTGGKVKGSFKWALNKANTSSASRMKLDNSASIAGTHYATRNKEYTINSPNMSLVKSASPITSYQSNPSQMKNDTISYTFSYEYTNHYINHYTCTDQRADG